VDSDLFIDTDRCITDTIAAKRSLSGLWYLEEIPTGRISRAFYLSYEVAAGALDSDGGFDDWGDGDE